MTQNLKDKKPNNLSSSKLISKSAEPKIKEKKTTPVYMNAPFKTEPIKFSSKISGSSSVASLCKNIEIAKKIETAYSRKSNLTLDKKELDSELKKLNSEQTFAIGKKISFSKIAPDLDLPSSFINLQNQNNKYRLTVFNALDEKRKKMPKKHPFINKLEVSCNGTNSLLKENNSLVKMRSCIYKANYVIEKFQNELKYLEDKSN